MAESKIGSGAEVCSSIDEMIACVSREIGMRERVYPAWVSKGKMKAEKAGQEIATMRDVLNFLLKVKQGGSGG